MYKKRENLIESNIKWIWEIPSNWGKIKLFWNIPYTVWFTPSTWDETLYWYDYNWITIADMDWKYVENWKNWFSNKAARWHFRQLIKSGSLLYSFKLSVWKVAFNTCDLFTNEAIASFWENKHLSLNYLYYYLPISLVYFANENIYWAKLLNQELINNAKLCVPPKYDQEKIANFLDKEVWKIDLIIKKEKELLEKTKQKKEVLIYNTVTKWLDKDIEMVESGIKWIWKIPKGWILRKIKHIAKTYVWNSISDDKKDLYPYITGAIPYISTKNIEQWTNTIDYNVDIFTVKKDLFKEAPKSSTLLCIEWWSAWNKIGFLDRSVSFWNKLCCFVWNKFNNKKYIYYYLQSNIFKNDFYESMTWMIWWVSQNSLKNIKFIQPPQEDQEKIANFLDKEVWKIDLVMGKIENQIKKYKEFKESLIFNAVTWKIEVE